MKRSAQADPSFEDEWEFYPAYFAYENNGLLSFDFEHKVENSEVSIFVSFMNIEPAEGKYVLVYHPLGGGLISSKPTSFVDVVVGGDALAESYVVDSTSIAGSVFEITCISKNYIEGYFQGSYTMNNYPYHKVAPWIPDQFRMENGRFKARKN